MSAPVDAHTCPPRADIPCPECGPSSYDRDRLIEIVAKTLCARIHSPFDPTSIGAGGDQTRIALADAEAVVDALGVEPRLQPGSQRAYNLYRIRALEDR